MSQPISMEKIKELRERTGVGVNKCKEALEATSGDMEQAIEHLRKTGMAAAVKKEGRTTNEGIIGAVQNNKAIALVEVNAETDFVVKNAKFQEFVQIIAEEVAKTQPPSLDAFLRQTFSRDAKMTIDQYRASIVQMIGENIQIRRLYIVPKKDNCSYGLYSHLGGKVVTFTELVGNPAEDSFAREIAMHVAASAPDYIAPENVPNDILTQEKEIIKSQIENQIKGKPEQIVQKILEGKLKAYYDGVCLVRQKFIKDDTITIEDLIKKHSKDTQKTLQVTAFGRWTVGQKA